jgi:hypothetical protein
VWARRLQNDSMQVFLFISANWPKKKKKDKKALLPHCYFEVCSPYCIAPIKLYFVRNGLLVNLRDN